MIKRNRGWIALSAIVLLLVAGVALGKLYLVSSDPHTAPRAQLARWLVLSDLSQQSRTFRLSLVDRLLRELGADEPIAMTSESLTPGMQQQLDDNVRLLRRDWFLSRVEKYALLPPEERLAFLRPEVATVDLWANASVGGDSAASQLFDDIAQWIEEAPPGLAGPMGSAVAGGLQVWLSTADLEPVSAAVRRDLAVRIAQQLDQDPQLPAPRESFSADERKRFAANGQLLMEAWLQAQAQIFAGLPQTERQTFVEEKIDRVLAWGVLDQLFEASSLPVMLQLASLTQRCIDRAKPELKQPLQELTSLAMQTLLQRQ
ncbi:hypothetical protein [Lignipirellula cremea]|uniref:Uncharacterized protein n=1 Tax=Lignipirellula cremea TaxID=2528010 RepID=A0A518DMG0_9BACT|nr:hypothetical protein [Lignipirellula cremea]QDU93001.1 hypothetical protein Pla8534_07760 [Lignipirellula cremea]